MIWSKPNWLSHKQILPELEEILGPRTLENWNAWTVDSQRQVVHVYMLTGETEPTPQIGRFAELKESPLKKTVEIHWTLPRRKSALNVEIKGGANRVAIAVLPFNRALAHLIGNTCVMPTQIDHFWCPSQCASAFCLRVPTTGKTDRIQPHLNRYLNVSYRGWLSPKRTAENTPRIGAFHCKASALMHNKAMCFANQSSWRREIPRLTLSHQSPKSMAIHPRSPHVDQGNGYHLVQD